MRHPNARTAGLVVILSQLFGGAPASQASGPAHLVKDINTTPTVDSGSAPNRFLRVGGITFFMAKLPATGFELWRTDGTEAGTFLVKDSNPGPAGSGNGSITAASGTLYFGAYDGANGDELWKSDGTEAGTVLVTEINPGPASGFTIEGLNDVNGMLIFQADDGVHGQELWRSDGTGSGTVLIQDIAAGPAASFPYQITLAGNRIFFGAQDETNGRELWTARSAILLNQPGRALRDLGDEAKALGLPVGIEASLTAKLVAAARALDRKDGGSTPILVLEAFMREVEAQSPRHIPVASAPALLEFALEIAGLLEPDNQRSN